MPSVVGVALGGCGWKAKRAKGFSEIRLEQVFEVGANTLAISCPYCMANFNDGVTSMDKADVLEVKDISELVAEAL